MKNNEDRAAAWWLDGDQLASGTPEEFFPFFGERGHVISLVGGGGKTTTMYHLAQCFARRGMKTVVMTSTKIGCPPDYCADMDACLARFAAGEYAVCGERLASGKLDIPAPRFLDAILASADAVMIEADGAHRKPCKAPAEHEPVLLPQSDIVVAVMGIDALGKPVQEICHRSERVAQLLGCGGEHLLTPQDMAALLLSEQGSRKNVGKRDFYVLINKCDDDALRSEGRKILEVLRERGQTRAAMTTGMCRSEEIEHGVR